VIGVLTLIAALVPPPSPFRDLVAAPIPPGGEQPLYYPAEVGAKWVWEFSSGGTRTLIVTDVKDEDSAKVVTVGEVAKDGKTTYFATMRVSVGGLFEVGTRVLRREAPLCELKLPHKDGAKWEVVSKTEQNLRVGGTFRDEETWQFTATGPEEVKVPAGTFTAIRVKAVRASESPRVYWYAPQVGLVKAQFESRLGAKKPTVEETVLKSFTPAKK
jgi:hypothetical protein